MRKLGVTKMYHLNVVLIECSECGSDNYEKFYRPRSRGCRCLDCGHEEKEEMITVSSCCPTNNYLWTYVPENSNEF